MKSRKMTLVNFCLIYPLESEYYDDEDDAGDAVL